MSDTIDSLLAFLKASPSPFHATLAMCKLFEKAGFERLQENETWSLSIGKAYYYTRSDASFVAFRLGDELLSKGARVLGAHTDSPCLKLKPSPELSKLGYKLLGIEVYGGALLNPWFDRDLSLAGKVSGLNTKGELVSAFIDFKKAIATVPSLAIHLNRDANNNKSVNPQKEMNALLQIHGDDFSVRALLLEQAKKENPELNLSEILDFNICFYDVQPPALIGLNDEFIASARLDNLLSCYLAAESVIKSDSKQTCILICNDHEEVGSRSELGAQGTMLNDLFARLQPATDLRQQTLRNSLMFSIDNAHGIHPNYPEHHDAGHGPLINQGPVIKFDADQSYATSSESAAFVKWLAGGDTAIPLQSFVTKADCRCGSTIGPITATNVGIKAVDIGNPQFAMHSCRELAGVSDAHSMCKLIDRFLACEKIPF